MGDGLLQHPRGPVRSGEAVLQPWDGEMGRSLLAASSRFAVRKKVGPNVCLSRDGPWKSFP